MAGLQAQEVIDAIRSAYSLARIARKKQHIIRDRSGLRVVETVTASDDVLIRDITPPAWNRELQAIAMEAYAEFEIAEPALRRMAELIKVRANGKERPAPEIDEIVDEVIRTFVFNDDYDKSKENYGVHTPRPGLFTRLFGSL